MRNVQLKHIDALLRHLGLIKAKLLTNKREDPFMNKISDDFKKPLNEKMMENLDRLCHHMKPEITLGKIMYLYFIAFFRNQLLCSFCICQEFLSTFLRYQLLKVWGLLGMANKDLRLF